MNFKWFGRGTETLSGLRRSIAKRFGMIRFKEKVLKRRVPETPWYQSDGATLTTLLAIQVVTGATMALYYTNAIDFAYESVQHINQVLPMGRLVRGIHYWTAGTMVVVLFLHLFRHLALGGYKTPREGTWTIGVFQFWLVLTMAFSGYVLPWDERAVYAVRVVLNFFHKVPFIGDALVLLVQGGPQLGAATLTRFFAVHVLIVPLLLLSLVGVHLYLVVIHGVTSKAERLQPVSGMKEHKEIYREASELPEGEWFHPHTVLLTGFMAFLVFCGIYVLALVVGPPELYPKANLVRHTIPMEEWWYGWYSALIALLPSRIAPLFYVLFPIGLFVAMLLLPIIDRSPYRGVRNRPVWAVFVALCVIGILGLSGLRIKSSWTGWPEDEPPPVPAGVVLSERAEAGRLLFARYGCNSCHSISARGRAVGPDLARIEHRLSQAELRAFILEPPADVPMPSYRGRISEADLDSVVDFVLAAQTFPRE